MHNYPVFYLPGSANFDFLDYSTVQFWRRLNILPGRKDGKSVSAGREETICV